MTVIARNRLFIVSRVFSFIVYIITTGIFLYYYFNNAICAPGVIFEQKFFLLQHNFLSVIFSIFVFLLYTLITQFFVFHNFARTRATEVLFFGTFLLGCMSEIFRALLPITGLASPFSTMYLVLGKSVIFGRILCPLSLLFIALMSEPEQRLNEERNLTVILFASMIFCTLIPVNATAITKYCTFKWGYYDFVIIFRVLVCVAAAVSLFVNAKKNDFDDAKKMAVGFAVMSAGYLILCRTDNYARLILGTVLLSAGTYKYLANLHKKYLWA